ncbi:MAG: AAA family ATPase [Bacteroidia bacterium]|nr:AAA family ATPase [Bacteroidia bacterium]
MPENKTDIIILRGAPGSGKSQTAKSLSRYFPKGARLEVDTIRQMVISVDWKNQQEHINMLQVSTGLVNDFLKHGFRPVIVVDTFSGNKIEKYLETLRNLDGNLIIKIFGLYVSGEELKKRLELRSNDEFRDFPICRKLNNDVQNIRYESEFQIDTTGLIANKTAEIIFRQLCKVKI